MSQTDNTPDITIPSSPSSLSRPRYPGSRITLGDREFVVPSLSVIDARDKWPDILKLNSGMTAAEFPERLGKVLEIVHAAVVRNYPDLTIDELGQYVSAVNAGDLLLTVAQESGFVAKPKSSDGGASGEADAPASDAAKATVQ